VDFLHSGAFVRDLSTGAVALYQHLGPARHLLQPVFGLCCNALGLGSGLLARRHPRRRYPPWRMARLDQDVAANPVGTAGPRRPNADPKPRRGARRRNDREPDAQRPGRVIRTYRTIRR
jgi:hypothetical protein